MNIYVGNLSKDMKDVSLREAFVAYGEVTSASVITDKYSGESRGFGFVQMPKNDEALKAIAGLNGKSIQGRNLKVNEARAREGGFGGGNSRF
ncbi:MAG: RNA-binding protein [Candidatus Aminicenantes bacterium RBG_13_59_9]|nr:MAG: RNA-binding protein [Candidatus Aminicenantes bacterium RBG_13_59_9]